MALFGKLFGERESSAVKKLRPIVAQINGYEERFHAMSDAELRGMTAEFKQRIENGMSLDELIPETFAVVREGALRSVGMRHFDVQLIGGIVLHQGRIAEMKTGEGKTLVATLPAYLNALTGKGVHVVTVNDYLAKRDAEWMGKVHRFLGLDVGVILSQMQSGIRRRAYKCAITYGTNSEYGFDYLRDNMCVYKEQMVQRDLNFAIVDEVDSILIDEARTPLIISGQGEDSSEMYQRADAFAKSLTRGEDTVETSKYDTIGMSAEEAFANSGDFTVDQKRRTVTLTANGVERAEKYFGVDHLTDAENTALNHYINGALKANAIFRKDVDYVIQDGEIMIVDEFTGRIMYGRRYNEGLHQAIEAKEHVDIKSESKTLATVTYQNFFRMYGKLSGMTGTAKTEEAEFQGIYNLDVVPIPTNRPNIRKDEDDVIYLGEPGKFTAVVEEIAEVHKTGRPILIGTISVEKSEHLSDMLSRRGVKHEVLNAKNHRKEAEIVAQAGKLNQVTIATNMAGRGTDILLGGNPDFLSRRALRQEGMDDELIEEATGHGDTDNEEILQARVNYASKYEAFKKETDEEHDRVVALGGLHIIGTERHESRRIDNQLRGRAGRQGDPGSTRFYLSLEDDLLRLFGGENIKNIAEKFSGGTDDMPMEMGLLTRQIENSQKRVEGMHFESRKHVLQYDDVMNTQREIIYGQRRRVLMGEDLKDYVTKMRHDSVEAIIDSYCPKDVGAQHWDIGEMVQKLQTVFLHPGENPFEGKAPDKLSRKEIHETLERLVDERYAEKEAYLDSNDLSMRDAEREILLRVVDMHWTDHIDAMDQLRQGIGLQAYGQRDPAREYAVAGFDMFEEMIHSINEMTLTALNHITIQAATEERHQVKEEAAVAREAPSTAERATAPTPTELHKTGASEPFVADKKAKIGRNDPCYCGSGKKYKNCHGRPGMEDAE